MKFTYPELIAAIRGLAVNEKSLPAGFDRVTTDSRQVRRGDLFWPLKGEHHDGHDFLTQAHELGASACVAEARIWKQRQQAGKVSPPAILVDDTLLALWDFAAAHRQRREGLVIGVTGSVGKTTTRNMLHAVLNARFAGVQSPHNFNNQFGVPLSLLQIDHGHEFAVLELAASRAGEIGELAALARPEVGIITAIAPAHLNEFGSLDCICRTKGELLEALPSTGFAVLNGDDERVRRLASRANCPVIQVGERIHNDVVAHAVRVEDGQVRFQVEETEFTVPAVGRHHLIAALISFAVGREIGMTDDEIAHGLSQFQSSPGRCCVLQLGDWTVIDDTYNSNPGSMRAACSVMQDWQQANQKILVTGDMLSLGSASEAYHRELGELAAQAGVHRLDRKSTRLNSSHRH